MSSIESALDELFRAPLGEFTGLRRTLVDKLRKQGKAAQAKEVAALKKPTLSAWVVNQLYFQAPEQWAQLTRLGAELQQLYTDMAQGGSSEKRSLLQEQFHRVIGRLTQQARRLLVKHGHAATAGTLGRITATLHALPMKLAMKLALRAPDETQRAGRLSVDVPPLGLEQLALFRSAKPETAARGQPTRERKTQRGTSSKRAKEEAQRQQARKRARDALRAAERELTKQARRKQAAAQRVSEARQVVKSAEAQLKRAEEQESASREAVKAARAALT